MEGPKKEVQERGRESAQQFFQMLGISETLPEFTNSGDFYSKIVGNLIHVDHLSKGHVTCSFLVKAYTANNYNGLHGGVVAAVAERVATACARTLVAEDKHLFLGEIGISYLSAAPVNAELIADASVVRSGRNLTVVSVELKHKQTLKLFYTARTTFFHLPASKL